VKTGLLKGAGGIAAGTALFMSCASLAFTPAAAASSSARVTKSTTATVAAEPSRATAQDPQTTSSVNAAEDQENCLRSRKRLWVAGEGWVVRWVTTCF
jgi:uncharacterized iron-regulated protein